MEGRGGEEAERRGGDGHGGERAKSGDREVGVVALQPLRSLPRNVAQHQPLPPPGPTLTFCVCAGVGVGGEKGGGCSMGEARNHELGPALGLGVVGAVAEKGVGQPPHQLRGRVEAVLTHSLHHTRNRILLIRIRSTSVLRRAMLPRI